MNDLALAVAIIVCVLVGMVGLLALAGELRMLLWKRRHDR